MNPDATDEELFLRAYDVLVNKFGEGGYAKFYFKDKQYLSLCKKRIEEHCIKFLDLQLNDKTQIGIVKNGIDFLGYRHILSSTGKIIVKLRFSSKQRMKKHLKTLYKIYNNGLVDDEYVYQRKNAFYNHIEWTAESKRLKDEIFPFD